MFRVGGFGFAQGFGFRVLGLGVFRVRGSGFGDLGVGFRVL